MAVPLIVAGIAAAGAIAKGVQKAKLAKDQKKAAAALKQKGLSGKTVEAEAMTRARAGQTTDTVSEAQREQLEQGAANTLAKTKEIGGSSVDQLQAIQATERQRQTGEQNIGIQQAGRKRQDEHQFTAALTRSAAEENRNNAAYKQEKTALLDARQQNIQGAIGNFANAGVTAAGAFAGMGGAGGGSGVATPQGVNYAPNAATAQGMPTPAIASPQYAMPNFGTTNGMPRYGDQNVAPTLGKYSSINAINNPYSFR